MGDREEAVTWLQCLQGWLWVNAAMMVVGVVCMGVGEWGDL